MLLSSKVPQKDKAQFIKQMFAKNPNPEALNAGAGKKAITAINGIPKLY
jgi:hypothetical protein